MAYEYRTSFTAADRADREETIVDGRFSSDGSQYLADSEKINLGTDKDIKIYHQESDNTNWIDSVSGDLYIRNTNDDVFIRATDDIHIQPQGNDDGVHVKGNAGVRLFYGGSGPYLETTSDGAKVTGELEVTGKVGIGTDNPTSLVHLEDATSPAINITDTTNNVKLLILSQNNNSHVGTFSNHNLVLGANSGEHLTIDTSGNATFAGNVHVGTTVTALGIDTGNNTGINLIDTGRIYLKSSDHSEFAAIGGGEIIRFRYGYTDGTAQSDAGSIDVTGTTTVAYNTTSDYRLKENEVSISDGITRLKLLKPYRFNFKAEPSKTVDGFFAHEVTPSVPEAITGEKDDPNIMQKIDQSKMVPLLTAALQEAIAKIETLETKVAELESA